MHTHASLARVQEIKWIKRAKLEIQNNQDTFWILFFIWISESKLKTKILGFLFIFLFLIRK